LAGAFAWLGALGAAQGAEPRNPIRLQRFVFDNRFAEAVAAARHAARRGIPLAEFAGDLTPLWYDDLDLEWRRAPMTLAGVTTREGLFVLETLAVDRGMRVAHRGAHGAAKEGHTAPLCSWIIAPRAALAATAPPATV
jgi:hypothetical protein